MNVLKRKLPLGAVALLLVLALAAIGLVYGNWTQTLTIGGTVTTGGLSVEWRVPTSEKCSDNEGDRGVKEWAQMTRVVKGDGKLMNVTLTNGYPNYIADCQLDYLYKGQIPAVVDSVTFDAKSMNCDVTQGAGGGFIALCGDQFDELKVTWGNGQCAPPMQDSQIPYSGSLFVEVLKGAEMKVTSAYDFNIRMNIVQWDKTTCGTNNAIS